MQTQGNENWLIRELQKEVVLLQQLIENQLKIIGIKEVQLSDKQVKIDQLEAERNALFQSFYREN